MNRRVQLKRNFKIMYWIQALTQMRVINVVATLFMISRGLTLSQIYLTAVVYSIVAILTELPSSYLADKWNRKGLITISIAFGAFYWFFNIFAYGFVPFLIAIGLFSLSYSLMSGTDEALMYDSARELGEEKNSLKMLGRFYASGIFFKIFTPILAVLIASKLNNSQFIIILIIDLVANLVALFLADFLVEASHSQRNEKINKGVMIDTINLFKNSPILLTVTLNRTLIFLASFSIWRINSGYFFALGAPLFIIGIASSVFQASAFFLNLKTHSWFKNVKSGVVITYINLICGIFLGLFFINEITYKNWIFGLILFDGVLITEAIRSPFFSDLINKTSKSYNRATTISGSSLVTELIKLPLLLVFSWIIILGHSYLFGVAALMAIVTEIFFSVKIIRG